MDTYIMGYTVGLCISMGYCKKYITPLLMHWSYVFLANPLMCPPSISQHLIWENAPFGQVSVNVPFGRAVMKKTCNM